jgi:hypothetical protein
MVRAKTDKPADDGAPKKVKYRNNLSVIHPKDGPMFIS